jgi:hypothetical protein
MFGMARPRMSSRLMMLRQRSRSLLLLLENLCHRARDFISRTILTKLAFQRSRSLLLSLENLRYRSRDFISLTILTKLHTSVRYGKTSNEFALHDAASKVKVTVAIFFYHCHRSSYIPIAHNYRVEGICIVCDILLNDIWQYLVICDLIWSRFIMLILFSLHTNIHVICCVIYGNVYIPN